MMKSPQMRSAEIFWGCETSTNFLALNCEICNIRSTFFAVFVQKNATMY